MGPIFFFVLIGAGISGFGIQLQSAIGPVLLRRLTTDDDRTRVFSLWALVLFPLASLFAAFIIHLVDMTGSTEPHTQWMALQIASGISVLALVLFFRIHQPPLGNQHAFRLVAPARCVALLAVFALLAFAGGITVPFLQLYFKIRFEMTPSEIAGIYTIGMFVAAIAHLNTSRLTTRYGHWPTAVFMMCLSVPFYALLGFSSVVVVSVIGFIGRNVCDRVTAPLLHQVSQELVGLDDGAQLAPLALLVHSAAWAAGNFLTGPLLANSNQFSPLFTSTILVQLIATLVAWVVFSHLKQSSADRNP